MAITIQFVIGTELDRLGPFSFAMRKGHSFREVVEETECSKLIQLAAQHNLKYYFRAVVSERGGGYSNTGHAIIPCSDGGLPLKKKVGGSHYACEEHAIYIAPSFWVQIGCEWARNREYPYYITLFRYILDPQTGVLDKRQLWEAKLASQGELEEALPSKLSCFAAAIKAAMSKATCYHCRDVHFK